MERKYRSTKKANLILSIVAVVLVVLVIVLHVTQISGGKAAAAAKVHWDEEMIRLEDEISAATADYEARGLDDIVDAKKAEAKDLKAYQKDLVKAWGTGDQAQIDAVIAEYEAPAEE